MVVARGFLFGAAAGTPPPPCTKTMRRTVVRAVASTACQDREGVCTSARGGGGAFVSTSLLRLVSTLNPQIAMRALQSSVHAKDVLPSN